MSSSTLPLPASGFLYITALLSHPRRHYGHGHHTPLLSFRSLSLSLLTTPKNCKLHTRLDPPTYGYEDEARRRLLLPCGWRWPGGRAPPEEVQDGGRVFAGRACRRSRCPPGGQRHVRGAAGRSRRLHTKGRRRVRRLAGRSRRRHAHVQEIQGARADQGGARAGVAAVPRGARQGLVGRRAPVPAALRRRRQPRSLLPSRHDSVLLPGREPRVGRGADGGGGGGRAPRGALLAGRDPVQRQRRRQGRPRPPRGSRAVRARGVAGPRRRAPRAGPLPPGRLRRATVRAGRAPPPHPGQRARARGRGDRLSRGGSGGRRQRQDDVGGAASALVPPERLRVPRRGRGGARGQPVPGGLVRVAAARCPRGGGGTQWQRQPRGGLAGGGGGGRRRRAAAVLAGAVRSSRDAAARVQAVLGVRRGELLLPRVPGAALEDGAQGGVHARGPVARRRRRRRRRGRRRGAAQRQRQCRRGGGPGSVTPRAVRARAAGRASSVSSRSNVQFLLLAPCLLSVLSLFFFLSFLALHFSSVLPVDVRTWLVGSGHGMLR